MKDSKTQQQLFGTWTQSPRKARGRQLAAQRAMADSARLMMPDDTDARGRFRDWFHLAKSEGTWDELLDSLVVDSVTECLLMTDLNSNAHEWFPETHWNSNASEWFPWTPHLNFEILSLFPIHFYVTLCKQAWKR